MNSPLIDIKKLRELITTNKVIILDATIHKVNEKIDNSNKILIPNSLFFDIEGTFSDHNSGLPNTMVDAKTFESNVQQLGIDKDSVVVIYDRWGVYSSPRAWWMFRYMGHQQTYVLNGGIKAWQDAGLTIVTSHSNPQKSGNFTANVRPSWFEDTKSVLKALQQHSASIVDARGAARFSGKNPEPRPGLRAGHIPTATNLSYDQVLDGAYMKDNVALQALFTNHTHKDTPTIFTCGSGVTAAILALAAYQIGNENISVYDGSWAEWGSNPNLPIE